MIGGKRSMRPLLTSLKSSIFVLAAALVAACAGADVSEAKRIESCDRPAIEQAMQRLYDTSPTAVSSITRFIDPGAFNKTCSGAFQARTPIMDWPTQSRYPEISIGWNVSYSINKSTRVCMRREASPKSAGTYETCHTPVPSSRSSRI